MTVNMATADRAIRITLAIGAALLILTGRISGTLAIVVGAVATVFVVTSFVGFCPLYKIIGFSTRRGTHPQPM